MTDSVLRVGFKVPDQVVDVNDELIDLGEEAGCFGEGGAGLAGVGEKVWLDLGLPRGGDLLEGRSHFIGGGPFDCLTQGNGLQRDIERSDGFAQLLLPLCRGGGQREIDQPVADPAQAPSFVDRHTAALDAFGDSLGGADHDHADRRDSGDGHGCSTDDRMAPVGRRAGRHAVSR